MTNHPETDTISDFAEGLLAPEDQASVAEHLATCPQCRDEVNWIRTLRERVRELPEEVDPPRDGWPEIEQRIRSGMRRPVDQLSLARQKRVVRRGFLSEAAPHLRRIAAVLVLMALPAGATYLLMRPGGEEGVRPVAESPGGGADAPGAADMRFVANTPQLVAEAYEPAIRELRDVLEANRDELQPGTIEILEENLRIIDVAIQDFYEALEADPANLDTARMLNGMYETKVQLLRQAASLTRGA